MKKRIFFFLMAIISSSLLFFLIKAFPPTYQFSFTHFTISIFIVFFPVQFLFIFSLITWLTHKILQGILCGLLFTSYFLLRLFDFAQPLYLLLLLTLFIILELALGNFKKKKSKEPVIIPPDKSAGD